MASHQEGWTTLTKSFDTACLAVSSLERGKSKVLLLLTSSHSHRPEASTPTSQGMGK